MRPVFRALAPLLLAALPEGRLMAQSVDPRLYDATLSPGALIGLDSAWIPGHLQRYAGASLAFAEDELVSGRGGERVHAPLHERWVTTIGLGLGLFERLELQLGVPLHLNPDPPPDGLAHPSFGVGDLRLAGRVALVREGPFNVTAQLALFLPTGGKTAFSGDDALVADPRIVLELRAASGLAAVLQLGYRVRPARLVGDLAIDDELRFGAGAEVPAPAFGARAPLSFIAELEGALGLGSAALDPSPAASPRKRPLEARLGVRVFGARWALTAAGGIGLSEGYGVPDFRFVVGFTIAPGERTGPRALPPDEARAPEPAPPVFPERAAAGLDDPAVFDEAVRDDPDPDGDGLVADACPHEAEDRDGFQDDDGCPDPDNDGDGVPDEADRCPTAAEVPNGVDDDDGCPDEGQATVVAKDGVIALSQTIEFRSGSDVLMPSAGPLLSEVAAVLKAQRGIRRVRIEGHTDGEGDDEMNVDLSERRAARVRERLMELGVDGARLLPRGFGATHPLAPNDTVEGRKVNRRVEFRIIDPPPPGTPRIDFDGGAKP